MGGQAGTRRGCKLTGYSSHGSGQNASDVNALPACRSGHSVAMSRDNRPNPFHFLHRSGHMGSRRPSVRGEEAH